MEMTWWLFIGIILIAAGCEFVDSSMGMGYSTILSPLLFAIGFDPLFYIPATLISQAAGGLAAGILHHSFGNTSFRKGSKDSKIFWTIAVPGVLAIIGAAILALNLPRIILATTIGVLIVALGAVIFIRFRMNFTLRGMAVVGIVSAGVEGIAGCGFGPIVTSGQIISGHKPKRAVGVTTLAEVPICITGFLTYTITKLVQYDATPLFRRPFAEIVNTLFSKAILRWDLIAALVIGVLVIAPFGPLLTKKIGNHKKWWHYVLGTAVILLGAWMLIKTHLM